MAEVYEKLKKVRSSESVKLKPCKFLRETIQTPKGEEVPLELRTYQVQMVYHMLMMKRFICGDDTGLGKTLESITTLCYIWEKDPDLIPIIVTTKSAIRQWAGEIDKFTEGVDWTLVIGGPDKRVEIYEEFFGNWSPEKPGVLITNYHRLVRDWRDHLKDHVEEKRFLLIFDECTAFKSTNTKTHKVCKQISDEAERVYGLTATLIKNNLVEGYGIFRVIKPDIFTTKKSFMYNYCITRMQPIGKGRKVPVVVGHSHDHVNLFRTKIDPYYLGRAKHQVADELPVLTTQNMMVELTRTQWSYYQEALEGFLTVNVGTDEEEEKETTKLTQLIYTQEIVDDLCLIGNEGPSPKVDTLLDMLDNQLEGEKVIVFTRFRQMVDKLQRVLEAKGYEYAVDSNNEARDIEKGFARVTGNESSEQRDAGRRAFTETEGCNIIFLTMAGAEAMNLQQAKVMVFFDLPWSAGDYLQLVGRMIRIGSPHQSVYAIHMVAEGPLGEHTIDHYVTKTLNKKMGFIEGALGERILGNDDGSGVFDLGSDTMDLFNSMVESAKEQFS